jgi:hypothetical protein
LVRNSISFSVQERKSDAVCPQVAALRRRLQGRSPPPKAPRKITTAISEAGPNVSQEVAVITPTREQEGHRHHAYKGARGSTSPPSGSPAVITPTRDQEEVHHRRPSSRLRLQEHQGQEAFCSEEVCC